MEFGSRFFKYGQSAHCYRERLVGVDSHTGIKLQLGLFSWMVDEAFRTSDQLWDAVDLPG